MASTSACSPTRRPAARCAAHRFRSRYVRTSASARIAVLRPRGSNDVQPGRIHHLRFVPTSTRLPVCHFAPAWASAAAPIEMATPRASTSTWSHPTTATRRSTASPAAPRPQTRRTRAIRRGPEERRQRAADAAADVIAGRIQADREPAASAAFAATWLLAVGLRDEHRRAEERQADEITSERRAPASAAPPRCRRRRATMNAAPGP